MRRAVETRTALRMASFVVAGVLSTGWSCEEPRPLPTFRVTFVVKSDDHPLGGARIRIDRRDVGATGNDGTLRVAIHKPEGSIAAVDAVCPEGFRSPTELPELRLRTVGLLDKQVADRGIEVSIACPPARRRAVVVVRTDGQPELPVRRLGQEIARTDASGTAHVLLEVEPNTRFQLALDTSERPEVRPQSPTATFAIGDADQIFLYDQRFEGQRPRTGNRPRRPRPDAAPPAPPGPHIPVRIEGTSRHR